MDEIRKRLYEEDEARFTRDLTPSEVAWLTIKLRTLLEEVEKMPKAAEVS